MCFVPLLLNKKKRVLKQELSFCDSAGARTQDPILKRDVLYLLSYLIPTFFPKSTAKLLLFFDITKYFDKKVLKICVLLLNSKYLCTFAPNSCFYGHTNDISSSSYYDH